MKCYEDSEERVMKALRGFRENGIKKGFLEEMGFEIDFLRF